MSKEAAKEKNFSVIDFSGRYIKYINIFVNIEI